MEAAKELKGNDFKLFMYFYSNKEDWTLGFSPKDVADKWGMSLDTARNCFNNLIDIFEKIKRENNHTILAITHQERILNIADEIILLKNGEIFCDADINKVKKEFGSVEQFLIKYIK